MKTLAKNILKILIILGVILALMLPTLVNVAYAKDEEENEDVSVSSLILNNVERVNSKLTKSTRKMIYYNAQSSVGEGELVQNFPYQAAVYDYTVPQNGIYKLECQAGSNDGTEHSENGGYACRYVYLEKNSKIYVRTGQGAFEYGTDNQPLEIAGATYITNAKIGTSTYLENYKNNRNNVLIVAGAPGQAMKSGAKVGGTKSIAEAGEGGGIYGGVAGFYDNNTYKQLNTAEYLKAGQVESNDEIGYYVINGLDASKTSNWTLIINPGKFGSPNTTIGHYINENTLQPYDHKTPYFAGGEGWIAGATVATNKKGHLSYIAAYGGSSFIGWPGYTGTSYSREDWNNMNSANRAALEPNVSGDSSYYVKYENKKMVYTTQATAYKNEAVSGGISTGSSNGSAKVTLVKSLPDDAVSHNINYVLNGGVWDGSEGTKTYDEGVGLTLPTNVKKNGYNFDGWFENASFSGIAVTSIAATTTTDKTFYAKWSEATYTLTLCDANSDSITTWNNIAEYSNNGYTVDESQNNIKREYKTTSQGFTVLNPESKVINNKLNIFAGWSTNRVPNSKGTYNLTIPTGSYGNKTYYANWIQAVAYIDKNTGKREYYNSLQSAVDNAKSGEEIVLLDDINESVSINTSETITLNLNNKTITNDEEDYTIKNYAQLTIKDEKVEGSSTETENTKGKIISTGIAIFNNSTLNVYSGIIESTEGIAIYNGTSAISNIGTANTNETGNPDVKEVYIETEKGTAIYNTGILNILGNVSVEQSIKADVEYHNEKMVAIYNNGDLNIAANGPSISAFEEGYNNKVYYEDDDNYDADAYLRIAINNVNTVTLNENGVSEETDKPRVRIENGANINGKVLGINVRLTFDPKGGEVIFKDEGSNGSIIREYNSTILHDSFTDIKLGDGEEFYPNAIKNNSKLYGWKYVTNETALKATTTYEADWTGPVNQELVVFHTGNGGRLDVGYPRYEGGEEGDYCTAYNQEEGLASLPNATKEEEGKYYIFRGWYDNSGFTGNKVTSIPAETTGLVELWAKFEEAHKIDLYTHGGKLNITEISNTLGLNITEISTNEVYRILYGINDQIILPTGVVRKSDEFLRWIDEDGTIVRTVGPNLEKNIKLDALYKIVASDENDLIYNVTLNADGGTIDIENVYKDVVTLQPTGRYLMQYRPGQGNVLPVATKTIDGTVEKCKVWYDINGKSYPEISKYENGNLSLYAVYGTPYKIFVFLQDVDEQGNLYYREDSLKDSPVYAKVRGAKNGATVRFNDVKDVFNGDNYILNTELSNSEITINSNETNIFRLFYDIEYAPFTIKRVRSTNGSLINEPTTYTIKDCKDAEIKPGDTINLNTAVQLANARCGELSEYTLANSDSDTWTISATGKTEIVLEYTPQEEEEYVVYNWYENEGIPVGTELTPSDTQFTHDENKNGIRKATEGAQSVDLSKLEEERYKKTGFTYFKQVKDNTNKIINIYWIRNIHSLTLKADDGTIVINDTNKEVKVYDTKYKYSANNQDLSSLITNISMKPSSNIFDGWVVTFDGISCRNYIPGGANEDLTYYDIWHSSDDNLSYVNVQYYLQKLELVNGKYVLTDAYETYGTPIRSKLMNVGSTLQYNIGSCVPWAEVNESLSQLNGVVLDNNEVMLDGAENATSTINVYLNRKLFEVKLKFVENATITNYGDLITQDDKYNYFFRLEDEPNAYLPAKYVGNNINIAQQGYIFAGWHTNSRLSEEPVTVIPNGSWNRKDRLGVESILTYWADWNRENETEYYVDVYIEKPLNEISTDASLENIRNYNCIRTLQVGKLKYGQTTTLADSYIVGLLPTGYTWDKENKLNEIVGNVSESGKFTTEGVTNNHLKVFFQRAKYNLTLLGNGGTLNGQTMFSSEFKFSESAQDFPTVTASREGYTLKGWIDAEDEKEVKTIYNKLPANICSNKTYLANWVSNSDLATYANYNVKLYKENEDLTDYVYSETIVHTGLVNSEITIDDIQVPEGYNIEKDEVYGLGGILLGDNRIQVEENDVINEISIFLNRNKYTANLYANGGIIDLDEYKNVELISEEESVYNFYYTYKEATDKTYNYLPIPTNGTNKFAGWFENSSFIGDNISQIVNYKKNNYVFYANWQEEGNGIFEIHFNIQNEDLNGYRELSERILNGQNVLGTKVTYDCGKILLNDEAIKDENGQDIIFFADEGFEENITYYNRKTTGVISNDKLVLNIYLDRKEYNVILYPEGGLINNTAYDIYYTTYHYGADDNKLPIPTNENMAFAGWCYNDDNEPIVEIAKGTIGNKEYIASYVSAVELNGEYTVEYFLENLEGEYEFYTSKEYGQVAGTELTINGTDKFNIAEKIAENTFAILQNSKYSVHEGFTENANLGIKTGTVTTAKQGEIGHLTLRLYFDRATYNISYITNGGTINGDKAENYKYSAPVFTSELDMQNNLGPVALPTKDNVVKPGFKANVWFNIEDVEFEKRISQVNIGEYSDKKYVADWLVEGEARYSIVTHYQDSVNSTNYPISYIWSGYTGRIGTNTPVISEENYMTFCAYKGYKPNVNHAGTVNTVTITEDGKAAVELYFDCDESITEKNNITLLTNGGIITGYGDLETVTQNSEYKTTKLKDIAKLLPTAENVYKENYVFTGWYYIDNNGEKQGPVKVVQDLDNNDKVFSAEYKEIDGEYAPYTVRTYYRTLNNSKKITFDYKEIALVNSTVKIENAQKYCAFEGYKINREKSIMIGTVKADGSLVLELYFDYIQGRDEYNVTLEPRGGTILSGFINKYIYGIPQELPLNIQKASEKFLGWYEDLFVWENGPHYIIKAGETGDKTFYARWPEPEPAEGLTISSTEYVIGNVINPTGYSYGQVSEYTKGDKYISRVAPRIYKAGSATEVYQIGTTVAEFMQNITISEGAAMQVLSANGSVLSNNDLVRTGAVLKVSRGLDTVRLTIIVIGDLDGDGLFSHVDVDKVLNMSANVTETNTQNLELINMASDFDFDGMPTSPATQNDVDIALNAIVGAGELKNK